VLVKSVIQRYPLIELGSALMIGIISPGNSSGRDVIGENTE
jgi:hypothetical protein